MEVLLLAYETTVVNFFLSLPSGNTMLLDRYGGYGGGLLRWCVFM